MRNFIKIYTFINRFSTNWEIFLVLPKFVLYIRVDSGWCQNWDLGFDKNDQLMIFFLIKESITLLSWLKSFYMNFLHIKFTFIYLLKNSCECSNTGEFQLRNTQSIEDHSHIMQLSSSVVFLLWVRGPELLRLHCIDSGNNVLVIFFALKKIW